MWLWINFNVLFWLLTAIILHQKSGAILGVEAVSINKNKGLFPEAYIIKSTLDPNAAIPVHLTKPSYNLMRNMAQT